MRETGRGMVLVTGHIGSYDLAGAWREAVETAGLKFGLRESDLEVVWVGLTEAPSPPDAHWGQ